MPSVKISDLSPTLRFSIRDGIFYAIMFGAGESYLSAYGVSLGLNPFLIGLLVTLPLFVGSAAQLVGVRLMEATISRRKIIVLGVIAQALSLWIIAALPWVAGKSTLTQYLLIVSVILYSISGQIGVPAWTSLMGDLVPNTMRGKFFGTRNQIMGYFLIASFVTVGYLLNHAQTSNSELLAFSWIFIAAGIARLLSAYYLERHDNPAYLFTPDDHFTIWQFISRLRNSNFARFVFFHATLHFGMFLAGPYFVVHMLRDLNFTYWEFTLIQVSGLTSNYMSMRFWGSFGDRFGNKKILKICASFIMFVPALWLVSNQVSYLIGLQLMSGCAIAGIQISATNFLLDAVSPGKRGRCAAYMNFISACFVISGAICGSFLINFFQQRIEQVATWGLTAITAVFICSSLIRFLAVVILLPTFKEVREVEPWTYTRRFYRITRLLPLASNTAQYVVGMFRNRLKPIEPTENKVMESWEAAKEINSANSRD